MNKRSKAKKSAISILVSVLMIFQCLTVYGADVTAIVDDWANFVPSEAKNTGDYKEVPIYYNGNLVTEFDKYLRRYNDTAQNSNQKFDYSGIAKFRAKSFAYNTGEKVKVGTYIEQLTSDGVWKRLTWLDKDGVITKDQYNDYVAGITQLSISIDVNFAYAVGGEKNQNQGKVDVVTSWGSEFDRIVDDIVFYTNEIVFVDRTVTEVAGEKNVWEVAVKVEAKDKVSNVPTDVVFVLDRSGSMNETRRELVSEATQELADSLLELDNINIGLVTFGQYAGSIPSEGAKYYDANWEPVRLTVAERNEKYSDPLDRVKWAGATVDEEFTDDDDDIKESIEKKLKSVSGGTPISLALIEATKMFMDEDYLEDTNNGKDTNKVIILVSDGAPSFTRDGSGTGNIEENDTASWEANKYIVDDTIAVSKEALTKVDNLTIFTLAAGNGISDNGKAVLKECASSSEYAYTANDSEEELEEVMKQIAKVIEKDIATGVTLSEELTQNISLDCPDGNHTITNVKLTNPETGATEAINWGETTIAITQGAVVQSDDHKLSWNIGQLKNDEPAVIKYRINLDSGKLGEKYNVSKDAKLTYTDSKGRTVSESVPNEQIDLSWAKINMTTIDQKTSTVVDDSEVSLWYEVPETFTANSMKFNHNLKYNSDTQEVSTTGNKVVKDTIKLDQAEGSEAPIAVGTIVDNNAYGISEMNAEGASLTQSPTTVMNLINNPIITSQSNDETNYIHPEGTTNISANITFASKSKDVSYKVDSSNIINAKMDSNTLMNYDFAKATVQVKKVSDGNRLLVDGVDYTMSLVGSDVIVEFIGLVYPGDEFKVDIYVPTKIGEDIVYGGSGNSYLNNVKGTTIKVDNVITSTPKVSDFTLQDGSIEEVYGVETAVDSTTVPENKITLTYIVISQIH